MIDDTNASIQISKHIFNTQRYFFVLLVLDFRHSDFRLFTGLMIAAFMAW